MCRGWRVPLALSLVVLAHAALAAQSGASRALDDPGSVGYFIGVGDATSGYSSADRRLAQWAIEAWQRAAGAALKLTPAPEATARVRLYWAGPNGGQYGETRPLVVGGHIGAAVFIRPDTTALGPEIAALARTDRLLRDSIVYLTCVHELGHALGLAHTADFRDIMYSFLYGGDIVEYFSRYRRQLGSRAEIPQVSGLSDDDVARIRRLYPPL
jgi:hypothetical protein